jgi:hypothetical protein
MRLDWLRMIDGATALNSASPPATSPPVGSFQLWRYEFENNGNDASGNGLTLTLEGAPVFEDTPPQ